MNQPASNYVRSHELLDRAASRLLIVDVQEKLIPTIAQAARVVANCRQLIDGAQILGVPVFATEQYPKGLGPTVASLREGLSTVPEKLLFSCAEVLNWGTAAEQTEQRFQVVVAGIESHVCVLQTVLDLLSQGYRVYVPADAVSSRQEFDWKIALDRMSNAGATITTTESVLFEWCERAGTPEFKQISQLIKSRGNGT
ncbi:MAG: hydrolase [Planctomycetes bacterium]|nr:hydrolase [Planctomycetota bacterium]